MWGNHEEFSKDRRLHQTTDVAIYVALTQLMCSPRPLVEIKSDDLVVYSRGARTAKSNPFERGSILPWLTSLRSRERTPKAELRRPRQRLARRIPKGGSGACVTLAILTGRVLPRVGPESLPLGEEYRRLTRRQRPAPGPVSSSVAILLRV